MLAVIALLTNVFNAPSSQLSNRYLQDVRHFSGSGIVFLLAVTTVVPGILGVIIASRLAERGRRRPLASISLLLATGAQMVFFLFGGPTLWLTSAAATITGACAGIVLATLGAELFATEVRGTANAFLVGISVVGSAGGLLLAGQLSDHVGGIGRAIAICGIASLLAAFVVPRCPSRSGASSTISALRRRRKPTPSPADTDPGERWRLRHRGRTTMAELKTGARGSRVPRRAAVARRAVVLLRPARAPGARARPGIGRVEEIVRVEQQPSGLGWTPDGRMLIVSMIDRRLLRLDPRQPNGSPRSPTSSGLATFHCNDMVVAADGRAYVGNFGFDLDAGAPHASRDTSSRWTPTAPRPSRPTTCGSRMAA